MESTTPSARYEAALDRAFRNVQQALIVAIEKGWDGRQRDLEMFLVELARMVNDSVSGKSGQKIAPPQRALSYVSQFHRNRS